MKPHKHAELIKAWADGAEIQIDSATGWIDLEFPGWSADCEYRIKPEPKQNKRPELPWHSSEELTIKKAQEIGVQAYAGEGWQQWRARISQKIKQLEEQL